MTGETTSANKASLTLPPVMTVETVEALAAEFKQMQFADKGGQFVLDAGQVENITTPGLQLILSLERTLSTLGSSLVVKNQRDSFIHACRDLGFEHLLKAT